MDLALTGKRAIVTGSTGGIGEGIAKMLAREGAAVVVHGRNESAAQLGVQPLAALPHYSATKAAVINMTVSLAKELANTGLTVEHRDTGGDHDGRLGRMGARDRENSRVE